MAHGNDRTQDWVLELSSLPSLEEPTAPATPSGDSIRLPQWPSEILPGEGSPPTRPRDSRPPSVQSAPLPGAANYLELYQTPSGRLKPARQARLRNNLLASVGFLELANAGDFAANVFNQTTVPPYALALMVVGGLMSLSMIYFAVKDARLSYGNLRALRQERNYLRRQRELYRGDSNMLQTVECFMDMNTRESGTEMVDRIGMDILLGFSSLLVGIGTFLAMDGDHDSELYFASNLMTGYVGNTPCAIFGVANIFWSSYVWMRARKQQRAAMNYVKDSTRMSQMLRNRTSSLQMHAALNGITGVVAGAAAMVTATMWWGYVVLIPCIVTSGLVNIFWRRRLGYERPLVTHHITSIDQDIVVEALRFADACRRRVMYGRESDSKDAFTTLVENPDSIMSALEVIQKTNLFEEFCVRIFKDEDLYQRLFTSSGNQPGEIPIVDWDRLVASEDELLTQKLLTMAKDLINEEALKFYIYQERHLLELLGCYMCRGAEFGRKGKRKSLSVKHAQVHRNANTYAGRHANDWLFGGFSLTQSIKGLFQR
ncbi:hypothetical protein N0V93_009685 [Gnomoniopsis smithogilvyi]|uniref:Integral membrane protein n=1 Tax=Gnomoniopsis smithogilvyi TaxID=1191159 RepID=A0A9W9CTX2_9PEZI|nr:hypothetical protein N0V93_009685 [Gnomoniopsis smithogilvyi]